MRFLTSAVAAATVIAPATMLAASAPALAAEPPRSIVHPIYAQMPEAPQNDVAQREMTRAAARYKLLPVEVVDIDMPPPPPLGAAIKAGVDLVKKLAFDDARKQLDPVADKVAQTGGA